MFHKDTSLFHIPQIKKDIFSGLFDAALAVRPGLGQTGAALISSPVPVVNSGIDTLHLSYDAKIPGQILSAIIDAKKEAQSSDFEEVFFKFGQTKLFSWVLGRTGIKYYPYVLTSGDVKLFLSSRRPGSTIPNMSLHVGSLTCQDNLSAFLHSLSVWFEHYNFVIISEKVSRIDLAADLSCHIDETGISNTDKWIKIASKHSMFHSNYNLTGLQVGKGDIVFRCYDKIREMSETRDEAKEKFFQERWGNIPFCTRCEFQLRRGAVKSFFPKKSDLKTVQLFIPKVWEYLTSSWFRLMEKDVDRLNHNQSRGNVSLFWSCVQCAFSSVRKSIKRNRTRSIKNVSALISQAAGCMISVVAAMGVSVDSPQSILVSCFQSLLGKMREVVALPSFREKFECRQCSAVVAF